jgi:hypothetical protein
MQRHLAYTFYVLVEHMDKLIMAAKPENKPLVTSPMPKRAILHLLHMGLNHKL